MAIRALMQSESVRALDAFRLHFISTPSSISRSSMRSVTVVGGIRRGLQATVAVMTAPKHPQAMIDLIEICIQLPIRNGTQKWPRRGPRACDASHDLTMFPSGAGCRGSNRTDCVTLSAGLTGLRCVCTVRDDADTQSRNRSATRF